MKLLVFVKQNWQSPAYQNSAIRNFEVQYQDFPDTTDVKKYDTILPGIRKFDLSTHNYYDIINILKYIKDQFFEQ